MLFEVDLQHPPLHHRDPSSFPVGCNQRNCGLPSSLGPLSFDKSQFGCSKGHLASRTGPLESVIEGMCGRLLWCWRVCRIHSRSTATRRFTENVHISTDVRCMKNYFKS